MISLAVTHHVHVAVPCRGTAFLAARCWLSLSWQRCSLPGCRYPIRCKAISRRSFRLLARSTGWVPINWAATCSRAFSPVPVFRCSW